MILQVGSKGDAVKSLQSILNITPDGIFGEDTKHCVCVWQSDNGHPITGEVTNEMWNELFPSDIGTDAPVIISTSTENLDLSKLKGIIPDHKIAELPEVIKTFNINSKCKLAHFLAQASHESWGFTKNEENLNYSEEGLCKIFHDYFLELGKAAQYAHQPEKIANHVYANKLGNSTEESGDGFKFRGRGDMETTGKYNYGKFGEFIKEDLITNPDLVASKYSLAAAAYFFTQRKIWDICDRGVSTSVIEAVTAKVNAQLIGLAERTELLIKIYNALK